MQLEFILSIMLSDTAIWEHSEAIVCLSTTKTVLLNFTIYVLPNFVVRCLKFFFFQHVIIYAFHIDF